MRSRLTTKDEIAATLREHMRLGTGLTVPYARKWAIGGCEPTHSLWTFPHDEITTLASGLVGLDVPVYAVNGVVLIDLPPQSVWLAAHGGTLGPGRVASLVFGIQGDERSLYVGNSADVVLEIVKGYCAPPGPIPTDRFLQIGFPGIQDDELTYVGSWQWNVHGEARTDEYVRRAANATVNAIRAKESHNAG